MTAAQDPKALFAHARHELRTPVNAIIGYSEMLLEDAEQAPSAFAAALQEIQVCGKHLHSAINRLLDASRAEADPQLSAIAAEIATQLGPPCRQVLGLCQELLRQTQQPELSAFASDLQRVSTAAGRLLAMLDNPFGGGPHLEPPAPVAEGPAPTAEESAEALLDEVAAAVERLRSGHILVVDDNEFNRNMLARSLYRQGHTFALAANGRQALELLQSGAFDLVLLDIMMPEVDGFQVLQQIKANAELKHTPVIMISALDEIASVVRCIEMGAEDYLPKPFDPVLLRARVGACLEKKRLRDQELDYLRNVAAVTAAAAAVESGNFDPDVLQEVADRTDQLGQLARVFQSMAHEVRAREQRLQMQVQQLRVEIDEHRKATQVAEITESNYFQELQQRARALRNRQPKRQE